MTCAQAIGLLAEYLESVLGPEECIALEAHLGDCPACTAYLNTYRRTRDAITRTSLVPMPDEMKKRLGDFLRRQLQAPGGAT